MKILVMTNTHPDFYHMVGPFLGNREIARELGSGNPLQGVIWDDVGKKWFLVVDGEQIAGFATMITRSTTKIQVFCEAYVFPAYRDQGIHNQLIDERLAHCIPGSIVQVIACASSRHQYETRGFTIKRQRGKDYMEMIKKIGEDHE